MKLILEMFSTLFFMILAILSSTLIVVVFTNKNPLIFVISASLLFTSLLFLDSRHDKVMEYVSEVKEKR